MQLSVDTKNAALQGIADKLNAGANASAVTLYVGDVLAAEIVLPNPAEQIIADGVMTFNKPAQAIATASGVPTRAELIYGDGALAATLDVATEITLDKDKIYQGGYVGVTLMELEL